MFTLAFIFGAISLIGFLCFSYDYMRGGIKNETRWKDLTTWQCVYSIMNVGGSTLFLICLIIAVSLV